MISRSRSIAIALVIAGIAGATLAAPVFAATAPAAGSAGAITATPATAFGSAASSPAHWEAVAGNFARVEDARELRVRLAAAGLAGFRVEVEHRDGRTWFQVERPYAVRANAVAEVLRLHAHGFRGWSEYDAAGVR
jgi:SPOR domain